MFAFENHEITVFKYTLFYDTCEINFHVAQLVLAQFHLVFGLNNYTLVADIWKVRNAHRL